MGKTFIVYSIFKKSKLATIKATSFLVSLHDFGYSCLHRISRGQSCDHRASACFKAFSVPLVSFCILLYHVFARDIVCIVIHGKHNSIFKLRLHKLQSASRARSRKIYCTAASSVLIHCVDYSIYQSNLT